LGEFAHVFLGDRRPWCAIVMNSDA